MSTYFQFFAYENLAASVGFAPRGNHLAVHLPATGTAAAGDRRYAERRELFERLIEAQVTAFPDARVVALREGRLDTPRRDVREPLSGAGIETLRRAFVRGVTFRFDFWLDLDAPVEVTQVAEKLGLSKVEHSPVPVMWPDDESTVDFPEDAADEAFCDKLHDLIEAVTNPSSTDSSKWRGVEEHLATVTNLSEKSVVVGYVSDQKFIHNRIRQRYGQAGLRLVLAPHGSTAKQVRKVVEDTDQGKRVKIDAPTFALATKTPEGWRITDVWVTTASTPDPASRLSRATGVQITVRAGTEKTPAIAASGSPLPPSADDEEELAESLFVPVEWLRDVLWLLEDKRGVVLYGPPGTGKTYIANQISAFLQSDERLRTTVQLHPSFGYEEFFEGYRPVASDGGAAALRKCSGPLKRLVDELDDETVGIMVIDEMNRGNLPRVFGELYYLLEYRDRPVRLMYADENDAAFRLPDGLRIIGTMNTADRSVALLDQALRRRFHFVGLFPREEPVRGMLRGYLAENYGDGMNWVADVLENANAMLDRNVAIGPSHFMRPDLDTETVKRIWEHSVLPTIEEHYFGQEDRVAEFELEALRPRRDTDDGPLSE